MKTERQYPVKRLRALAITLLAALAFVNFTVAAHADDVRIPDKVRILTAYGFKGGVFDSTPKNVQ